MQCTAGTEELLGGTIFALFPPTHSPGFSTDKIRVVAAHGLQRISYDAGRRCSWLSVDIVRVVVVHGFQRIQYVSSLRVAFNGYKIRVVVARGFQRM